MLSGLRMLRPLSSAAPSLAARSIRSTRSMSSVPSGGIYNEWGKAFNMGEFILKSDQSSLGLKVYHKLNFALIGLGPLQRAMRKQLAQRFTWARALIMAFAGMLFPIADGSQLWNRFYPGFGRTAMFTFLLYLTFAIVSASFPEDLASAVADLLVDGQVVARFDGAMEFGPRALGNRTLMVRPDAPDVNEWLNTRLERTEFMPFAPVVLEEDADRLFVGVDKARDAARFMTVCFEATDEMKRLCPGCVHVDGTARPQIIRDEDNPGYAAILRAFKEKTGIPALINTSFNMHEEPIVCTPNDAVRAWDQGQLDALVLGPFLVKRERP